MLRTAGLVGLAVVMLAACGRPESKPSPPLPPAKQSVGPAVPERPPPPSAEPYNDLAEALKPDPPDPFAVGTTKAGPLKAGPGLDVRLVIAPAVDDPKLGYCEREESLALVARRRGRQIGRRAYCSSYGRAELTVEKDARGASYAVVIRADGRGPGVTAHWMEIYQIKPGLPLRTQALVYRPSPLGTGWEYKIARIERPAAGGLRYHLRRQLHAEASEYDDLPPRTKIVTVRPG